MKRKKLLLIITLSFLILGGAVFLWWFFLGRFEVKTQDAYVQGNQVVVTPQISGFVQSITVQDTELVEEGRILIQLDPVDQKLALEGAKNTLAETVRNVTQMVENVGFLKAEKEVKKAELTRAGQDYQHRKKLVKIGGVSKEEFEHSEAAFIASFAGLLGVQHQLRGALALVENTTIKSHPLVEKAKDEFKRAYVNLQRCTIRCPVKGMVAMKKAQVGESVFPETPLMTIVPLNQIWVDANFKENHLGKVRIGQSVKLHSDLYGSDVPYQGKVTGIGAATGSVLSVLPPQNATGNWIKIVQRLPIRIELDPQEVIENPLRLGLSMHVTVDIHDTSGKRIPPPPPPGALFKTNIFAKEEKWADKLIDQIIEQNSTFSFNKDEEDGRD